MLTSISAIVDRRRRGHVYLELTSLLLCLVGLIGLVAVFLAIKRDGIMVDRLVFVSLLTLVSAPFFVALRRSPKILFLIPPVVTVFLLYPIGSPYGIVFSRDPVFNFQFTRALLETGFWVPGSGTYAAQDYSLYPIGNVFTGIATLATGSSLEVAYLWVVPLTRLAVIPAAIYAISRRLLNTRAAALGLLLYLGTGSIVFNLPVQQEMAVIFIILALLALAIMASVQNVKRVRRLQILLVVSSTALVMTHHLSSYVLAMWLIALVGLPRIARIQDFPAHLRLPWTSARYLGTLLLYTSVVTFSLVSWQITYSRATVSDFANLEPITDSLGTLGRTFTPIEIYWIVASVLGLLVLGLIAIRRLLSQSGRGFVIANGLFAAILLILTIPMIGTSAFFSLPLRNTEYVYIFLAPLGAWTLVKWADTPRLKTTSGSSGGRARRKPLVMLAAIVISSILFMGGSLVPLATRHYFEPPLTRPTDSPLFVGQDAMRAAAWADEHFLQGRVWGDGLALVVFAGFAEMEIEWGQYAVFNETELQPWIWTSLAPEDFVVVNRYMTLLRPEFYDARQPDGPLDPLSLEKFANDSRFALVYQDTTFTVYWVVASS